MIARIVLTVIDVVAVKHEPNIKNLVKVHILPFADSIEGISGDLG